MARGLRDRQPPEVMEGQEQSIAVVEPIEGPSELTSLDRTVKVIDLERCDMGEIDDVRSLRDPAGRADDVAAEPRRKRVGVAQAMKPTPRREHRFLHGIGGIGPRTEEDSGGTEGLCELRLDELTKRGAIAATRGADESSAMRWASLGKRRRRVQDSLHIPECRQTPGSFILGVSSD
jgi:hypothetical protein